jgi:hypothetical protein
MAKVISGAGRSTIPALFTHMGWGFYSHQMVSNQHFDEASGLSMASGVE